MAAFKEDARHGQHRKWRRRPQSAISPSVDQLRSALEPHPRRTADWSVASLGQHKDVTIFNLSCNETIEAHVIELLARKIRMFELVIGELDLILGNLEGNKSFEDLLREAWEAATSGDDLRERLEALGDVLVQAALL